MCICDLFENIEAKPRSINQWTRSLKMRPELKMHPYRFRMSRRATYRNSAKVLIMRDKSGQVVLLWAATIGRGTRISGQPERSKRGPLVHILGHTFLYLSLFDRSIAFWGWLLIKFDCLFTRLRGILARWCLWLSLNVIFIINHFQKYVFV